MCKYTNQLIDDKLVTWDGNIVYNKIIMFSQRQCTIMALGTYNNGYFMPTW